MAKRMMRGLVLACSMMPIGAGFAQAEATMQPSEVAGAYLAARSAGAEHDFSSASDWFLRALSRDPTNPGLIDNALLALICLGELERAAPVAEQAVLNQVESQIANMVMAATAARTQNWGELIQNIDDGLSIGLRVDTLAKAWALLGQGDQEAALATFDAAAALPGSRGFGTYHRAMALAVMGRLTEADEMLSLPAAQGVPRTARSVKGHIQILTQLDRFDEALVVLDAAFSRNMSPAILGLRQAVVSGQAVPFDVIANPTEGIAEVFFTEGGAYMESSPPEIVLLYSQTAQNLHPDDATLIMMSANLLEQLDRYEQAAVMFAKVPYDDPAFQSAEFGRASVLRQSGQPELAIEVLHAMLRGNPELAMVHSELGDILRVQSRFVEADAAYTTAIDLVPNTDSRHWALRYKRGITRHQLDNWTQAEADFRAALDLNPGQASLLNYLGYSLIERGEKLEEAFEMINRAITAEPENGAIVDSLAWALFSLGRYQEAVVPMERAAALLPEDPVILDHLGDVYFSVGRTLEARFQWSRALSYSTDEEMDVTLRDKMENGLQIGQDTQDDGDMSVAQDL